MRYFSKFDYVDCVLISGCLLKLKPGWHNAFKGNSPGLSCIILIVNSSF